MCVFVIFRFAGDEFDKLRVPVGGDQLTRVRLDGAKCLRLGSPSARESFDNLFPVVIEMFHTQMDFLEVSMIILKYVNCVYPLRKVKIRSI